MPPTTIKSPTPSELLAAQQATSTDTQIPLITITRADTDDKQGIVTGRVSDNVGVAELTVDGNIVPVTSNGSFEYSTYVSAAGKTIQKKSDRPFWSFFFSDCDS